MTEHYLAEGELVSIRKILPADLNQIAGNDFSVSVVKPLGELSELNEAYAETELWGEEAGAVAVVESSGRLVGTCQFFRSGPCIHGLEIGYIIHSEEDRGNGFASAALQLLSEYLLNSRNQIQRLQLTIETSNSASVKVAEKGGYQLEGTIRNGGFPPAHADCYLYSKIRS